MDCEFNYYLNKLEALKKLTMFLWKNLITNLNLDWSTNWSQILKLLTFFIQDKFLDFPYIFCPRNKRVETCAVPRVLASFN